MNNSFNVIMNLNIIKSSIKYIDTDILDARGYTNLFQYNMLKILEKKFKYILVDNLNEGLLIRSLNSKIGIIVKNIHEDYVYDAIVNNIAIVVYNKELINSLVLKDDLQIFWYLDVGENMFGIKSIESLGPINDKHIKVKGIISEVFSGKNYDIKCQTFLNAKHDRNSTNFLIDYKKGKNVNISNIYSLIKPSISILRTPDFVKSVNNEPFLNKMYKTQQNFAIIKMPLNVRVKEARHNDKKLKIIKRLPGYLILAVDEAFSPESLITIILQDKDDNYLKECEIIEQDFLEND